MISMFTKGAVAKQTRECIRQNDLCNAGLGGGWFREASLGWCVCYAARKLRTVVNLRSKAADEGVRGTRKDRRTLVLAELRLENYAVIDNVVIEFAPGLNLLTGETGAGKSILIDALGLLLGDKASSEGIRTRAERAGGAALFVSERTASRAIEDILETNGLDAEDGS